MSENRETFSGEYLIKEDVYRNINEEAENVPKRETGGMMFGSFDESGEGLDILVEKVVHIPDNAAQRTAGHFGIEPEYADRLLDEYCPEYTYLGNWHSHLNYGGPSQGDYQQVERFFETNENRDLMIAMIMDRKQLNPPEFVPIPEVYRRSQAERRGYTIERVEEITLYDTLDTGNEGTKVDEMLSSLNLRHELSTRLHTLANNIDEQTAVLLDHDDSFVYVDEGGTLDEVVLCLPVQYREAETEEGIQYEAVAAGDGSSEIQSEPEQQANSSETATKSQEQETTDTKERTDETEREREQVTQATERGQQALDLYLKISVPVIYPADEIYVDIATRDMTRQLTVSTFESAILEDDMNTLVSEIENHVENNIPNLLVNPLADSLWSDVS